MALIYSIESVLLLFAKVKCVLFSCQKILFKAVKAIFGCFTRFSFNFISRFGTNICVCSSHQKTLDSYTAFQHNQGQLPSIGLFNIHGQHYIRNSLLFPQMAALVSFPLSLSILPLSSSSFHPD